jgi:pimeloyl-ACP methyl ester carboxylesterase
MTTVTRVTSHHWRVPASAFTLTTGDGVRLEGTRLGDPVPDRPAVVLLHGLMGWHRKPRFAVFGELLTEWYTVYAPDLRGHGESAGVCDFGGAEILDVEAAVEEARRRGHRQVLTVGTSMGGIAAIRHAALIGGVEGVVAISSLAYWDWHGGANPRALRSFQARVATVPGRTALRAVGVHLPESWEEPESPEEVVGKVAPTPIAFVHGSDDHLFSVDHAHRLYDAAGDPKRLLIGEGFGHGEDGLTHPFAHRLARVIDEELASP